MMNPKDVPQGKTKLKSLGPSATVKVAPGKIKPKKVVAKLKFKF